MTKSGNFIKVLFPCFLSFFIVFSLCSCKNTVSNPTEAYINGRTVELKKGDNLSINAWGDPEYLFNDKVLKKCPSIYKDVKIGDGIDKVLKTYGIKEGYAVVDREVGTKEADGTTEIITEVYKNLDFFETESVLDANFTFGFSKQNDGYVLVTAQDVENKKADVIYRVDFVGSSLADDACVKEKQVISLGVERIK